jgi:hypothetical protein
MPIVNCWCNFDKPVIYTNIAYIAYGIVYFLYYLYAVLP